MDTVAEYRFPLPLYGELRAAGEKLAAAATGLDAAIGWKGGIPYPGYGVVFRGVVPVTGPDGVNVMSNGDSVLRIRREGGELVVSGILRGLPSADAVAGFIDDIADSIADDSNRIKVKEQTLCGSLPMVLVDAPDGRVAYVDLPEGVMAPYFSDGREASCKPFSEFGPDAAKGNDVRAFRYDGVAFVDPLVARSRSGIEQELGVDTSKFVMSQLRLGALDLLSNLHYYAFGRKDLTFDGGLRLGGVAGIDIARDGSVALRDGNGSVLIAAYVDVEGRVAVAFDDKAYSMRPLPQPKSQLVTYVTTAHGQEVNVVESLNSLDRAVRAFGVTAMVDYCESVLLEDKNVVRYSEALMGLNEAFIRENVETGLAKAADVAFAAVYLAPGTDEFDAWLKDHDEDFFEDVKREDVLECCRKLDPVGMDNLGSVAAEAIQHTLDEIFSDHIEVKRSLSLS